MSLHVHSLVAYVLPIIVISKVFAIEDPSKLNQNSETSEHHMPGVPAQGSTVFTHCMDIYTYMTLFVLVCVGRHVCVLMKRKQVETMQLLDFCVFNDLV